MTREQGNEGTIVELVTRIAREREQATGKDDPAPEVVTVQTVRAPLRPPTRLFPDAPRRSNR